MVIFGSYDRCSLSLKQTDNNNKNLSLKEWSLQLRLWACGSTEFGRKERHFWTASLACRKVKKKALERSKKTDGIDAKGALERSKKIDGIDAKANYKRYV